MRDQIKTGNSAVARRNILFGSTTLAATAALGSVAPMQVAQAQQPTPEPGTPGGRKPNILFIMGDDIGWFNVSAYNMGIMGYRTPNIDRIGREGAAFTDWYGQQSCTAGRAAFITGQSPIRTGLTKVGLPGAQLGLSPDDPSVADVMKSLDYATGQFGKNHLGDRNEHLPTVHGFDEFFGNLYHLNAEEEPENPDYPKDPKFRQRVRAARCLCTHMRPIPTIRLSIRSSARSGSRKSRTLARSTPSAWRQSTTSSPMRRDGVDGETGKGRTSRSSAITTRRACTSLRISRKRAKARRAWVSTRTAWSSTTGMSASFSRSSTT